MQKYQIVVKISDNSVFIVALKKRCKILYENVKNVEKNVSLHLDIRL